MSVRQIELSRETRCHSRNETIIMLLSLCALYKKLKEENETANFTIIGHCVENNNLEC